MNSLAMDPFTLEILDPYKGLKDIKARILRHTSEKFYEDPLRVLRGMQFAGRFQFRVDSTTIPVCKNMFSGYGALAKERVWEEWLKWATKSIKPSFGIRFLNQTSWINHYPQLANLRGIKQEKEWHPEGSVYSHTLHVIDAAAKLSTGLPSEEKAVIIFAALCHDFGKETTTEFFNGRIRSHGHEVAGAQPTKSFLNSIGCPKHIIDQVVPLVVNHLAHITPPTQKSVRRLSVRLAPATIDQLLYVIHADHMGRPPLSGDPPQSARDLAKMAQEVHVTTGKPKPLIMGRHLIEIGMKPGREMGEILSNLYELQLDGAFETVEEGLNSIKVL